MYPWALLQGNHTVSARERKIWRSRRASCHLSISCLQVLFTLLLSPPPVHTHCFSPLQPLCFSKIMQCSILHVIIVETQERLRNSKTIFVFRLSKLLLSVFIYCWITVHFTPVTVQWTSVWYHVFCHSCMPVLLPSLFTACEIIFLPPNRIDDGNKLLRCVIHANAVLRNTCTIIFLPSIYIFSLFPLNSFGHKEKQNHKSVSHRANTDKCSLTPIFRFLPNSSSWVWEQSIMRKPCKPKKTVGWALWSSQTSTTVSQHQIRQCLHDNISVFCLVFSCGSEIIPCADGNVLNTISMHTTP